MDLSLTPEQEQIREQVLRVCARFGDGYWLEHERESRFPDAFYAAMAEGNWLGIAMPEAYGGAGLGITEAATMMQAVAAAMSGASAKASPARRMMYYGARPTGSLGPPFHSA